MSHPHPVPPYAAVPPPAAAGGPRGWIKSLSGGMLAFLSITTVVVCCVSPVVFCAFSGVFDRITEVDDDPTVIITDCEILNNEFLSTAQIRFTIEQDGFSARSYTVRIEVHDENGRPVGGGSDYVPRLEPGRRESGLVLATLTDQGKTCHVAKVS